jgi:hypothetical protein
MQGPFSMGTGAESVFHLISSDLRLKSVPIIYTSDNGSLSCRLTSYTTAVNLEEMEYNEDSELINFDPEELFQIDSLDGKEKLLEIMKEQRIAEDFPVKCKTEEKAIEILKILLDSKAYNG